MYSTCCAVCWQPAQSQPTPRSDTLSQSPPSYDSRLGLAAAAERGAGLQLECVKKAQLARRFYSDGDEINAPPDALLFSREREAKESKEQNVRTLLTSPAVDEIPARRQQSSLDSNCARAKLSPSCVAKFPKNQQVRARLAQKEAARCEGGFAPSPAREFYIFPSWGGGGIKSMWMVLRAEPLQMRPRQEPRCPVNDACAC